jgi:ribosome-binding protein aMBF1 (putative translation factor)
MLVCELCDKQVPGRIRKELYGSALMVCEPCHHLLEAKKSQPYSRIVTQFCRRAAGYLVNVKMARIADQTHRRWMRYG